MLLACLVLSATSPEAAAVSAASRLENVEPLWLARGHVRAASTIAFDDSLALGVGLSLRRHLLTLPLYLGGRLSWSRADEANRDWRFTHDQISTAVTIGTELQIERGLLWIEAGVGAATIVETRRRHQFVRLEELGIDRAKGRGWSVGPYAVAEAGVSVSFYGPWSVTVSGGPHVDQLEVRDQRKLRIGWYGHLGLGFAF